MAKVELIQDWEAYLNPLVDMLHANSHEWAEHTTLDQFLVGLRNHRFGLIGCFEDGMPEAFLIFKRRASTLAIVWGGGEHILKYVPDLDEYLTSLARVLELRAIEMTGQPAWEKELKKYEFSKLKVTMRKEV